MINNAQYYIPIIYILYHRYFKFSIRTLLPFRETVSINRIVIVPYTHKNRIDQQYVYTHAPDLNCFKYKSN